MEIRFPLKSVLVILIALQLIGLEAKAGGVLAACLGDLDALTQAAFISQSSFQNLRSTLIQWLRNPDAELMAMIYQRPRDVKAITDINVGGASVYGVFTMHTERGQKVLKVLARAVESGEPDKASDSATPHRNDEIFKLNDFAVSFILQKFLGELEGIHITPQIDGLILQRDLARLVESDPVLFRQPERNKLRGYSFGIYMEEIPDAWGMPRMPFMPFKMTLEAKERAVAKIRFIERVLNELGIFAMDTGFLITKHGAVYVADMDGFVIVDDSGHVYGKRGQGQIFQVKYPQFFENGRVVPARVRNDFSHEISELERAFALTIP